MRKAGSGACSLSAEPAAEGQQGWPQGVLRPCLCFDTSAEAEGALTPRASSKPPNTSVGMHGNRAVTLRPDQDVPGELPLEVQCSIAASSAGYQQEDHHQHSHRTWNDFARICHLGHIPHNRHLGCLPEVLKIFCRELEYTACRKKLLQIKICISNLNTVTHIQLKCNPKLRHHRQMHLHTAEFGLRHSSFFYALCYFFRVLSNYFGVLLVFSFFHLTTVLHCSFPHCKVPSHTNLH